MPVLCTVDAPPSPSPPNHPHHVAVRRVGAGHGWASTESPRGYTHLLVAIDKFSKWIEARLITRIKYEQAVLFFTDIIHRFGIPNTIITDNGTQFTGHKVPDVLR